MKILSVVVPTYNTELYIERCLDSLLYDQSVIKDIEIIVVNDGGVDRSLEIAKKYKKRYPHSIVVVDKKNGGHGSTVNTGIDLAKGKYFRVIDSDDWVNIFDFAKYVRFLQDCDSDIVITDYKQDILYDESTIDFMFDKFGKANNRSIEDASKLLNEPNFFFLFSMHSMTIKTDNLRSVWGNGLLEKTFYVDQQYVVKALQSAKNFTICDLDIYRYFIGRPEQSVSSGGFFSHRDDHERVLKWILKEHFCAKKVYLKNILQKQILDMLNTHYGLYCVPGLSRKVRKEIENFDLFIAKEYPFIHKQSNAPAPSINIVKLISKKGNRND